MPFVVIYLFGFIGLAGFVPPHPPTMSGHDLAAFYDGNRLGIRAGQLISIAVSPLLLFWAGAVSAQMARIEKGPLPMVSLIQFGAMQVLVVFFMICGLIWTLAAYREDLGPDMLRMLNDAGWLIFVMAFPESVAQLVCIAMVGLADTAARPFLPRWACFFTLWVAFTGIGGGFATFVMTGPFAWNGLLGFWVPVAFFLVLLAVIQVFLLKAIRRQEQEDESESQYIVRYATI
jgi:hypothetical protein